MKIIDEFPMKIFVVARGKCGCNGTGVFATFDCGSAIDLRWQYISRSGGFDFEIGNQEHKMQSRRNLKTLHGLTARHRETTESGWGSRAGEPARRARPQEEPQETPA